MPAMPRLTTSRPRKRRLVGAAVPLLVLTVLTAPVGASSPRAAAPSPTAYPHLLIAPNFSSNVITVIDLQTNKIVKYIEAQAKGPCCAHVTPDGKTVMIVDGFSPHVTTIDTKTLSVRRVTTIGSAIGDIGSDVQDDGKMFWASDLPTGNMFGIDIATGVVKKTFDAIGPHMFVSRDGKTLFAAHNNAIESWSTETMKMLGSVPANGSTLMMLRDNKHLLVQGSDLEIFDVEDPAHMDLTRTIPVGVNGWVGQLTPDGSQYWIPGTDDGKVTIVDLRLNKVVKQIDIGGYGGGVDISKDGRAYVAVSNRPFAPVAGTSLAFAYAGVAPGAALGVPSTTERPGLDPPGEIYVYDAKTFARVTTPQMKLPSIAFVLEVVENPPTAAAARPARPVAPPASGGGAQPARPPASGASLPSTGGALSWPIAGALLLVGAVALRRRRRLG